MHKLIVAAALAAASSSCLAPESSDEAYTNLAVAPGAIVRGERDYSHDAVVALAAPYHLCTATIVAVRAPYLYLLTAAHCVAPQAPTDPAEALQGVDFELPDARYPIERCVPHPRYDGRSFDFAMCRAVGATASTPHLPPAPSDDALAVGTRLRHVGYGYTGSEDLNTERFEAISELVQLEALLLEYDQTPGGPCSGDSGGPQLPVEGPERVVGVTSYGDPDCESYGVSGRVAAVTDSFIEPTITADCAALDDCMAEGGSSAAGGGGPGGSPPAGGAGTGGSGAGTGGSPDSKADLPTGHRGSAAETPTPRAASCMLAPGTPGVDPRPWDVAALTLTLLGIAFRSRARASWDRDSLARGTRPGRGHG